MDSMNFHQMASQRRMMAQQEEIRHERHKVPMTNGHNQYLEITSTRRDRTQYPEPGAFVAEVSQSGAKDARNSADPVCRSSPERVWAGSAFQAKKDAIVPTPARGILVVTLDTIPGTAGPPAVRLGNATGSIILEVNTKDKLNSSGLASLQLEEDYYVGATLNLLTAAAKNPPAAPTEFEANSARRIVEYKYLGDDRAEFTISSPFNVNLVPGTSRFAIIDPTDLNGEMFRDPLFFVPNSIHASNYYVNSVLYNQTVCQSRPVKYFDGATRLLSIDTSGSRVATSNSGPLCDAAGTQLWTVNDIYSIRRERPQVDCSRLNYETAITDNRNYNTYSFNLPITTAVNLSENVVWGSFLEVLIAEYIGVTLGVITSPDVVQISAITEAGTGVVLTNFEDYWNGTIMRVTSGAAEGQIETIINYENGTRNCTMGKYIVDNPGLKTTTGQNIGFNPAPLLGTTISLESPQESRRIVKYVNWGQDSAITCLGPIAPGSLNTIIFPNTGGSKGPPAEHPVQEDGYYNDLFITIIGGGGPPAGEVRLIRDYRLTPVAGFLVPQWVATVYVDFSVACTNTTTFAITSGKVDPPFKHCLINQNFLILQWSYDNKFPFINSLSSNVTSQEPVPYEIELINLILPNQILDNGKGSLVSFYQYLYVELQNTQGSTTSGPPKSIISNNPNAQNMTFRAAMDDVPNPVNSSFIKIDGDGMVQVMKFNPNDNITFKVTFSDGTLFKTVLEEDYGPNEPNPLIQISALFRIRRLGRDEENLVRASHV